MDHPGPLAGLRVVDCSTILAGPFCTMLLADLGAEVVKVEPPEGDATRSWGPPWVGARSAAGDATEAENATAAYFLSVNRNKRSIRLDLRREGGAAVLSRLLERADAFVENFRPGGLARLGFGDADLERLNPRLLHVAISGYGPDGPYADRPGYDFVIQAASGLMSITGFPEDEGGRPTKVGVAVTDVAAGLFAAVGLLAALHERDGSRGGAVVDARPGQRLDVSLLGSSLALLVNQAQNAFVTGHPPERRGNAHPSIVPYETFATADYEIAVGVGSERQWRRLLALLGLDELARDPRFASNADRVEHRDALRAEFRACFARDTAAAWLERLAAADIPSGPINDVVAAFASPAARARRMRVPVEHPVLGRVDQVGLPIELARTPGAIRTPPPLLGEQTDEILAELGFDADEIDALRTAGAI